MQELPKTNCMNCNLEIDLYQKSINKQNGRTYYRKDRLNKYCSLECAQVGKQKNEIRNCEFCKNQFVVKPNSKKKFCNHYCSGKSSNNCSRVKSWAFRKDKIVHIMTEAEIESRKNKAKIQWLKGRSNHKLKRKLRGNERKEILIKEFGGKCIICGYNKCPRAMTFHHIDSKDKKFTLDVQNLSQKTWENIVEEAKKCQLLCFNCHMELHYNQT